LLGTIESLANVLILSTLAGLATALGGLVVLVKKPGKRLLGALMGLAAGVMLGLSFLKLLSEALDITGLHVAVLGFGAGAILMSILDFALPHLHFSVDEKGLIPSRTLKSSTLIAIGISLHNFPEGLAVAASYAYLPKLGLIMAVAMAVHNIPEGMAIALPLQASGSSRLHAFKIALLSGIVEPLGALVASLFLGSLLTLVPDIIPFGLAFAAGVMVLVTLDELLPVAHSQGHEHFTSLGMIAGLIITLLLLAVA